MMGFRRNDREHRYVSDRLSAFIDQELVSKERARVETHLSTCERCRADLRTLRWTKGLLQRVPAIKTPRSFVVREADVVARRPLRRRTSLFAAQWATAAVALLFILVLSGDLLTRAPVRVFQQGAPAAEMARVEDEAPKAMRVEQVEAVPSGDTPTAFAAEAAVTVVVEKEVEVAEKEVVVTAPKAPGEPDADVSRTEGISTSVADETAEARKVESESKDIVAVEAATSTPAPAVPMAQPEAGDVAATPLPLPAEELPVEEGDAPEPAVEPSVAAEEETGETTTSSQSWLLSLRSRVVWRVAEAILGLAFVGLLIVVVWMRRRG
jgi:anti-sigma factor RsiW